MDVNEELKELKEALKKEKKHSKNILRVCGISLMAFGIGTVLCASFLSASYAAICGFIMFVFGEFWLMGSFERDFLRS